MPDQTITIIGALGRDPELRYTAGGQAVANFSVACSHRWQDKRTEEWKEDTTWFRCTAWRELAENIAASCLKGTRVIVTGRMQSRQYEQEGQTRYSWELVADEIGPSLRWAQATVDQSTRTKADEEEPY